MEDPRTRPAAGAVLNRYHRGHHENFQDRLDPVRELPDAPDARDRKGAATDAQMHLRLPPGETSEFTDAFYAFPREYMKRFEGRTPEEHPGTESVEAQVDIFPALPPLRDRGDDS